MSDTPIQAYSKGKLAKLYKTSPDTLRTWLKKNKKISVVMKDYKNARILPPIVIKVIFLELGDP